jgi:hypothetical protein
MTTHCTILERMESVDPTLVDCYLCGSKWTATSSQYHKDHWVVTQRCKCGGNQETHIHDESLGYEHDSNLD